MSRPQIDFNIDSPRFISWVFWTLMIIAAFFVFIDATINYARWIDIGSIRRLCNIAKESGLAAWFASVQMLATAVVLWLIYAVTKKSGATKGRVRGWLVLAGFFTYLAVDDGAGIHERLGTALDKTKSLNWVLEYFPSYSWQVIFGPLFGAMGLFILYFLWREFSRREARLLYILALSCFGLAVGFDFIEGLDEAFEKISLVSGLAEKFVSHFSRVIEEYLELVGTACFMAAFLRHLSSLTREIRVRVG